MLVEFFVGSLVWLLWQIFLFCLSVAPVYTLILVGFTLAPYVMAVTLRGEGYR